MPPARFYELRSLDASASLTNFTPTAPGPGDVFAAGGNCTIQWAADQSGSWNNVTIDLMSGSNNNMSFVANVASGLDGTDASNTPFNWTCPDVDPYSDIYFYQFTNGEDRMDAKWTTRFTISSSSGEVDPPENPTQPDGSQIPWGVGHVSNSTSQASNATAQSVGAPEDEDYFNSLQASKKGSKHSDDKSSKEDEDEDDDDSAQRQKHSDGDSKSKHETSNSNSKESEEDEEDEEDRHSDEDDKHSEKDSKKGSSSDSGDDDDDDRHLKSSKADDDKKHSDDDEGDEKHSGDDDDDKHSNGDNKHATHKADDDDDEPGTHSAKTKSTQQDDDDDEPSASSYSAAEADSGSRGRPAGAGQSPLTMSLPPSAKSGSVDTIVHSDSPYAASDRTSNSAEGPSLPVTALLFSYTLLFLVLL
ncbi:hypothetical protein K523DRAFT_310826 [Schizophyllum commune Tattone D]|nr:hypothetical protein K525DRAFT_265035 [Schizophyllum commune Loenen D]KAI5826731.1 hypothetical protein K523DRAFT_310826 [Schizophyllum commune Tattone D]